MAMVWSAVDGGHVGFVVPLAGGEDEVVEPLDLLGGQFDGVGGGVLLDAGYALGAGNRGDVLALCEQPRQRDLRRRCVDFGGDVWTSSTIRRFFSKLPSVRRRLVLRPSSSASSWGSGGSR
jgi:hypothetical protein